MYMLNKFLRFSVAVSALGMLAALILSLSACSKEVVVQPAPLQNFAPTTSVQKVWENGISMGAHASDYLKLTPALANGKIFIVSPNGNVKAIANSGKTLWEVNAKTELSSGLGANSTMLFVGTKDGRVLALQQQNGRLAWQAPVISYVLATPAANDEAVIVRTESGYVNALQAATGKLLWSREHQEPALILHGSSSPKIVGNMALCGFANGEVVAFNLASGNVIWQQQIAARTGSGFLVESMVDIIADPVVVDNVVYAVPHKGNIAALNVKTGRIIWQKPLASDVGLTVAGDNIYVVDSNNRVLALSKSNGDEEWHQDAFANRSLSAPAVLGDLVVVGDVEGYVHWLSAANGRMAARTKMNGSIVVQPIPYDGALYVFSTKGSLVKFGK